MKKIIVEVDTETGDYKLLHEDGTVWSEGSFLDTGALTVDICGMEGILL